jgi:GNAT superfamily N-acetyltransferase
MRMDFSVPKRPREERTDYFRSFGRGYEEWDKRVLLRFSPEREQKDPWLVKGELTEKGKAGIRFAEKAYLVGDSDVRCHLWNRLIELYSFNVLTPSVLGPLKEELDPKFFNFLLRVGDYVREKSPIEEPVNPFLRAGRITLVPTACLEADASENLFSDRKELYEGYPELFGQPLNRMNLKETLEMWAGEGLAYSIEETVHDPEFPDMLGGTEYGFIALRKDRICALGEGYGLPKPLRDDASLEITAFVYAPYRNKGIEERAIAALSKAAKKGELAHFAESEYDRVFVEQTLHPKTIRAYLPIRHPLGNSYEKAGYRVEAFLKNGFMDAVDGPKDMTVLRYWGTPAPKEVK